MKIIIDERPLEMLTQEEKINRFSKFSKKDLIEEVIFLQELINISRKKKQNERKKEIENF